MSNVRDRTPNNPYVGPRTFTAADRKRFFGREAEAASLLARVVSERLLLFYAQSGAGKSSLINARLIPQLREEEGFSVLPVGRVGRPASRRRGAGGQHLPVQPDGQPGPGRRAPRRSWRTWA